ncbi:MAG TPA: PHB depolymerase family esterase [Polyangia bacterium]|nr:PHB depolymerase family esterase [Polyangia bacterium]
MNDNEVFARARRSATPARWALCFVLTAAACGSSSSGSDTGTGGSPGQGGTSASGGTGGTAPGTGGQTTGATGGASGGTTGTGGQAGRATATGGRSGDTGAGGSGDQSGRGGQAGSRAAGGSAGSVATGGTAGGAAGATATGTGGQAGGGSGSMASSGCGKTPTLKDGTQTIQSGGQNRSYMIRIPKNYDNTHPYWLIFGFHWVGGTANDVDSGGTSGYTWSYYGLREQADNSTQYQAIFVAPQGISNGWGNTNNQDVVFTDDMIKKVEGDLCVDTKHVFSTGFSYGGGMTKALGCQRPNVFRAIAVYSGADFLSGGCDNTTTSPIAFFGSHSITDGTNPYSSGITILNRFAMNDGCTAQTPPQPAQGSLTHVCTKFQGCKAGYPVEWCAFNGGGHTPAPVDGDSNGSGGGDKTWTKGEVWKFFTQF